MPTLGERLVVWLGACGIDTVFGIPGVHTVELYRGLAGRGIAHVTPRHEQGGGFMADGHARVTGRPAGVFVITGPGLTNVLTPMAQAHADSVPMLVVSAVNARGALGMEAGDLHEVRRQGLMAAQCAAFSHTVMTPAELPAVLGRALAVFEGARPRPVHIEIPRDLFAADATGIPFARPAPLRRAIPDEAGIAEAARMLRAAACPVILAGGGARAAAAEVRRLAERLAAPVVMTTNGRGIMPAGHPLAVPASPSLAAVRALIGEADTVLALGTEIGATDYDMYDRGPLRIRGRLIRIDIDPEQLRRGALPSVGLAGDAGAGARALRAALGRGVTTGDGADRARAAREAALAEVAEEAPSLAFLDTIRDALRDAPIVGDSTRAVYAGNLAYAAPAPGRWFNAATGYGALGYGLPAAVGAARALGGPVVCLAGDGGLQFTLAELGTAVEERLPVIVLVWDNRGYGEIRDYMRRAGIAPVGVDLHTPDFVAVAKGYGMEAVRMKRLDALPGLLAEAAARQGPTLIAFDEAVVLGAGGPA